MPDTIVLQLPNKDLTDAIRDTLTEALPRTKGRASDGKRNRIPYGFQYQTEGLLPGGGLVLHSVETLG